MPDERTVILWDVMGTLVYDPFYEDIPRFFGMTLDEVFRWKHPTAWVRFELGELTETEFAQSFFHDCRSVDAVGLRRCVQDAYQWLDGMPLLLQRLREQPHRAQSIRQCAFSNYPMWYEWIEEKLLLSRYLDEAFVSYQLGYRKPSTESYHRVMATLNVEPRECLFIDDREVNVVAARHCGWDAILYENPGQVEGELKNRNLLT